MRRYELRLALVVLMFVMSPFAGGTTAAAEFCDVWTVAHHPYGFSPTSEATIKTVFQMSNAECIVNGWGTNVYSSDGTRSGGDLEVYDTLIVVTLVASALPPGTHSVASEVAVISADGTSGDYASFNFGFVVIGAPTPGEIINPLPDVDELEDRLPEVQDLVECDVWTVAYAPYILSPSASAIVQTVYEMSRPDCLASGGINVYSSDTMRGGGETEIYGRYIVITFETGPLPNGYHSVAAAAEVESQDGTSGDVARFNFGFSTYTA